MRDVTSATRFSQGAKTAMRQECGEKFARCGELKRNKLKGADFFLFPLCMKQNRQWSLGEDIQWCERAALQTFSTAAHCSEPHCIDFLFEHPGESGSRSIFNVDFPACIWSSHKLT